MKSVRNTTLVTMVSVLTVFPAVAQEGVVTIEGTRIRGDQEVPTVLYLVPWKAPSSRSLASPDEQLMLERPLQALDRTEFRRLVSYHQHFRTLNPLEPDIPEKDRID